MANRFFITGLPRSRTAWLSALMDSLPGVTCVHEPSGHMDRWEDIENVWERYTGVSDSALGVHLGAILERFEPRTLVVKRPVDDVYRSLDRIGLPCPEKALKALWGRIEPYLFEPGVKFVEFDDLTKPGFVYAAIEHLVPPVIFSPDKVQRLMAMNVQADLKSLPAVSGAVLGHEFLQALQ